MAVENIFVILALIVAFLISFSATPLVMVLAHKIGAIDVPKDDRRVHKKPIPRIGGLAIFYGFIIAVLCFARVDMHLMGILIGSVIIVTVGVFDDIKPVRAIIKLSFQIVAAAVVVSFGVVIEIFTNPFAPIDGNFINLGTLSIPFTILWIVAITNAVNLIDGLDGLAVGVSSIVSIGMLAFTLFLPQEANVAIVMAALAGAGFGFLPYNFNPAKIFMGDTGATFLGFILACLSVQGLFKFHALISFAVPILILGLPIFDTSFAIIRRIIKRKPIMQPDRGHLHHRLLDMGFSQRQTVAILYTMTAILCLSSVVLAIQGPLQAIILIGAVLLLVLTGARYLFLDRVSLNVDSGEVENTEKRLGEENEQI